MCSGAPITGRVAPNRGNATHPARGSEEPPYLDISMGHSDLPSTRSAGANAHGACNENGTKLLPEQGPEPAPPRT